MDLFWGGFAVGFGDVVVLIEILFFDELMPVKKFARKGWGEGGGIERTISPSKRTFSPRTRKMPREMSA